MARDRGLYVETRMRAGMDVLWERSQDPAQHRRWDLRFTHIDCLRREEGEPQRFRYALRVLPGLVISGVGVSAGERQRPDGTRTSALRFASPHPLSLLARGRGYWRYIPDGAGGEGGEGGGGDGARGGGGDDAVRFLTGYDYEPRWGRFGRIVDRLVFRPLMGWATAWSFDRLRLWCERGITPERMLRRGLAEVGARVLAVVAATVAGAAAAGIPLAVWCAVVVAAAAVLVPPLPGTPAARRCLRRPPARTAGARTGAVPPALLGTLDRLEL